MTWLGYAKLPRRQKAQSSICKRPSPRASAVTRAKYAKLGLSRAAGRLDRTTQAMLLRQLYLAHFEARRFTPGARGCSAAHPAPSSDRRGPPRCSSRLPGARRLRRRHGSACGLPPASSPASRRAFHLWTLGRPALSERPLSRGGVDVGERRQVGHHRQAALFGAPRARSTCPGALGSAPRARHRPACRGALWSRIRPIHSGRLSGYAGRRVDAIRYLEPS